MYGRGFDTSPNGILRIYFDCLFNMPKACLASKRFAVTLHSFTQNVRVDDAFLKPALRGAKWCGAFIPGVHVRSPLAKLNHLYEANNAHVDNGHGEDEKIASVGGE